MKHKILYIAVFAGLGLGVIAVYDLTHRSPTDQKWHRSFNEDKDHERIMQFQDALTEEGIANDPDKLSKQLEAQLHIEDLIIKSREAEYAKITPFSAIIASLVSAFVGAIVTWLIAKRGAHDAPNR